MSDEQYERELMICGMTTIKNGKVVGKGTKRLLKKRDVFIAEAKSTNDYQIEANARPVQVPKVKGKRGRRKKVP